MNSLMDRPMSKVSTKYREKVERGARRLERHPKVKRHWIDVVPDPNFSMDPRSEQHILRSLFGGIEVGLITLYGSASIANAQVDGLLLPGQISYYDKKGSYHIAGALKDLSQAWRAVACASRNWE